MFFMSKLNRKLKSWVKAAIISAEQAQQIEAFEQFHHPHNLMFKTLILGVAIFGFGIIIMLTNYWDKIPNENKLIADGVIFLILSYILIKHSNKLLNLAKEALILFYIFYVLASIYMIMQIYHINAQQHEIFFFWCALTLPIVALSKSTLNIYLWSLFLISAYLIQSWFLSTTVKLLSLPLLLASLNILGNKITLHQAWLKAVRLQLFVFGLISLGILESQQILEWRTTLSISGLFSLIFIGLNYLDTTSDRLHQHTNTIITLIYASMLGFAAGTANYLLTTLSCIILLWIIALQVRRLDYNKTFNFLTIIIGLKFLMLFFKIINSNNHTAITFIILGVLIMIMAKLWLQYHRRLDSWFKSLA